MAKAKHIAGGAPRGGAQRSGRSHVSKSFTDSVRELSRHARQQALDQFIIVAKSVAENPALDAEQKIDVLYAAIDELASRIDLVSGVPPKVAPELWVKKRGVNPFEFAARVYPLGTSRKTIRSLDFKLYRAMYRWEEWHGKQSNEPAQPQRAATKSTLVAMKKTFDVRTAPASAILKLRPILRFQ